MELKWFFPERIEDAVDLIQEQGVVPHAGGTGLLLGKIRNVKALVDLGRLDLDFFRKEGTTIELGAMMTYADTIRHIGRDSNHILVKALSHAATALLRNRITIGGSVAYFPMWSDLIGPLVALESKINIQGPNGGIYDIEDFIKNRNLRKGHLITSVFFKDFDGDAFYYRATRTEVDYPAFTVTILCSKDGNVVRDIRIVITGNTDKYLRLRELENSIKSSPPDDRSALKELVEPIEIGFTGKKLGSAEYIEHLAKVALLRGLDSLIFPPKS
ncbi:MAG: hypothetical protein DRQ10_00875 [Candidatus Hydrothermota bacterium]|nr:MAG: hypothetical protein DRQ10_00875 [Candidatus Hydrothermae bacterium]